MPLRALSRSSDGQGSQPVNKPGNSLNDWEKNPVIQKREGVMDLLLDTFSRFRFPDKPFTLMCLSRIERVIHDYNKRNHFPEKLISSMRV